MKYFIPTETEGGPLTIKIECGDNTCYCPEEGLCRHFLRNINDNTFKCRLFEKDLNVNTNLIDANDIIRLPECINFTKMFNDILC